MPAKGKAFLTSQYPQFNKNKKPVCLACQLFLLLQTAFKKGKSAGIPKAEATTAKARAVVFLTYSSTLSMSGRIVEIIVANPAALAKFEIISLPKC